MQNTNSPSLEYHLKKDDILYFLHLHKAAGTTFIFILDSFFDFDSIYPYRFWNRLLNDKPKDFSKFRLVRGHFGYGLCRLLPRKPIFLTLLREPVKRTLSDYDHRVRDPDPIYKNKYSKKITISDFFNDPERRKTFENMQTYQIGLDPDILSITKSFNSRKLRRFRFREELPYWADEIPKDEIIKNAKKRLDEFEFVGIAERMEESLFLFYYLFGLQPLSRPWRLNPTKKSPKEIPAETIEIIKKTVPLDTELYNYAQQIFENRYSQMVKELKQKYFEQSFAHLPPHEMMYKMLEKHYRKRLAETDLNFVNSIDYDFRPKMSGSGWYYREIFEKTDEAFRWTGPETISTIDFKLAQDDDLIIQFRVMRAIDSSLLESLKLKVNEESVKITKLYHKYGKTVFEGIIPKSILKNNRNFTRLAFEIERTIIPHELNPLDPTDRALGLAFDRIKIVQAKNYDKERDQIITQEAPGITKQDLRYMAQAAAIKLGKLLPKRSKKKPD